jgi:hypothetical protein
VVGDLVGQRTGREQALPKDGHLQHARTGRVCELIPILSAGGVPALVACLSSCAAAGTNEGIYPLCSKQCMPRGPVVETDGGAGRGDRLPSRDDWGESMHERPDVRLPLSRGCPFRVPPEYGRLRDERSPARSRDRRYIRSRVAGTDEHSQAGWKGWTRR